MSKKGLYCSFCGKSAAEVKKLIAGPGVMICNQCTMLCMGVLAQEEALDPGPLLSHLEIDGLRQYAAEMVREHEASVKLLQATIGDLMDALEPLALLLTSDDPEFRDSRVPNFDVAIRRARELTHWQLQR